ncbi:hypothetical protein JOM56_000951 [Amanita muscaria]
MTTASGEPLHEFGTKHITGGLSRLTEGHCHPKVTSAAAAQCTNIVHSQCSIAIHGPYARLIEKLLPDMPHPSLASFFFCNSGTEAIEANQNCSLIRVLNIKGHKYWEGNDETLARNKMVYSQGAAPLMPGVYSIPFPFWHQQQVSPTTDTEKLVTESLYQLDLLFAQKSAPQNTESSSGGGVFGNVSGSASPPASSQLRNLVKHQD